MRIAIAGSGNVGGALARLWKAAGHEVLVLKRDAGPAEIASAEAVTLCLPWPAVESVLTRLGDLSGKILIDCSNPVTPTLDGLTIGGTTSAAEQVQQWQPGAKVVKAFNTLGAVLLGTELNGERPDGFLCGDDASAKEQAALLVADAGLKPVDVGPLRNARYLEPMAMLWIDLAINQHRGAQFAFKLSAEG